MAGRRVTHTGKDEDGDITKICGSWGERKKADAIRDIEKATHTYYAQQPGTSRSNVHVVNGPTGKYLRTSGDASDKNNLDNLPDC